MLCPHFDTPETLSYRLLPNRALSLCRFRCWLPSQSQRAWRRRRPWSPTRALSLDNPFCDDDNDDRDDGGAHTRTTKTTLSTVAREPKARGSRRVGSGRVTPPAVREPGDSTNFVQLFFLIGILVWSQSGWYQCFFFWAKFRWMAKNEKTGADCTRDFFGGKKLEKSPYFEEKNSHVADHEFFLLARTRQEWTKPILANFLEFYTFTTIIPNFCHNSAKIYPKEKTLFGRCRKSGKI